MRRVLNALRTHWWPWLAMLGAITFAFIGFNRHQGNEICDKVDTLDRAVISLTKGPQRAVRYKVVIQHRDGTRERATVLVLPRKSGNDAAKVLRAAACNQSNVP